MKNKLVGFFICMLLIGTAILPLASAINDVDKELYSTTEGDLIDNIYPVHLYGTDLFEIIVSLYLTLRNEQENVVPYLNIDLTNRNEISITIDEHLIITNRDGNTIFDDMYTEKIPAYWSTGGSPYLINHDVLKEHNYLTGFFKATLELFIKEDGSHKTIAFNGFFFNYGSIVLNPEGKVIT